MRINIIYNLDSYKKENDTKTFMNSESSGSVEFFLIIIILFAVSLTWRSLFSLKKRKKYSFLRRYCFLSRTQTDWILFF